MALEGHPEKGAHGRGLKGSQLIIIFQNLLATVDIYMVVLICLHHWTSYPCSWWMQASGCVSELDQCASGPLTLLVQGDLELLLKSHHDLHLHHITPDHTNSVCRDHGYS